MRPLLIVLILTLSGGLHAIAPQCTKHQMANGMTLEELISLTPRLFPLSGEFEDNLLVDAWGEEDVMKVRQYLKVVAADPDYFERRLMNRFPNQQRFTRVLNNVCTLLATLHLYDDVKGTNHYFPAILEVLRKLDGPYTFAKGNGRIAFLAGGLLENGEQRRMLVEAIRLSEARAILKDRTWRSFLFRRLPAHPPASEDSLEDGF